MIQEVEDFKTRLDQIFDFYFEGSRDLAIDRLCIEWIESAIDSIDLDKRESGKALLKIIREHYLPTKV